LQVAVAAVAATAVCQGVLAGGVGAGGGDDDGGGGGPPGSACRIP